MTRARCSRWRHRSRPSGRGRIASRPSLAREPVRSCGLNHSHRAYPHRGYTISARNSTPTALNGGQLAEEKPFPRYEERRREAAGWLPLDLGGHETVARLHLDLRTGPQAAGEGRHALDRLTGNMPDEQLDVLRLLVTELLSNSVRHGSPDGRNGRISLEVDIYANSVRVVVSDAGPGFERPEAPEPHPDRPGGWGLCLVDGLSDRWGVAANGRTKVWFEIDREAAAAA